MIKKTNFSEEVSLSEEEIDLFMSYLLVIYKFSESQDIRRVAKSLFTLLNEYRFSTKDLPIIKQ